VVEKQQQEKIPEIWETEEDKQLSVNKLKETYVHYARSHFIKQPHLVVVNQSTKWEIQITGQVIKEWRQKSRTRPRIIAIQLLDQMIKTAKLVTTEKDRHNTPGIEAVCEFENRCLIEGDLYKVRIAVKQQTNRRFAYYFGVVKIN
jgi:predicted transcriptional regulator YdeE